MNGGITGSGGFMNDLVFYGGMFGMNQGNQQFTMRNLTFHNCKTAINTFWVRLITVCPNLARAADRWSEPR